MLTGMGLIWLGLGGGLRVFDFGRWMIPAAAWLAPVCLLHFTRMSEPVTGLVLVGLVIFAAAWPAYRGVIPAPGLLYPLVLGGLAAVWTLPYVADRWLAHTLPGFGATLVFPLAWVAMELLLARLSPYGTWGAAAYTQYGNLPLMQLASVTGLGGIAFLVAWFAASVNWAWEQQFQWGVIGGGALTYAVTLAGVMLAGGARLAFAPSAPTLRVAVVGWPKHLADERLLVRALTGAQQTPVDRAALHSVQDYFLEASRREAAAGAKLVVWPELGLMVYQADEAAFLARASQMARATSAHLLMGLAVLRPGQARPLENKAVLVDAQGAVVAVYRKSRPVPGWEAVVSARGDGRLRTVASAVGRLASAICFDLDFPALIRQAGQQRADLLLVPASDWPPIKHLHHVQAAFRAVETGATLVRATRWGQSAIVDPYGRVWAALDDAVAEPPALAAQAPAQGVRTLYARVGDVFAWLCALGLAAVLGWAVLAH